MRKIKFHFFDANGLYGILVRMRFGTPIGHVAVEFENNDYFEASLIRGNIEIKNDTNIDSTKSFEFEVDDDTYDRAYNRILEITGAGYDVLAILGFFLGIKLENDKEYFCSEACKIVFDIITGKEPDTLRLMTPYDLYMYIMGYVDAQK